MKRKLFASLLILCAVGLAAAQRPPRKTPPKTSAAPATKPKFKAIWEPVNYKEDLNVTDVFFVNEKAGWVAGTAATILHTSDGGDTWTAQLGGDPQSKETEIRNLRFADATHGWATQKTPRHSNLFRTTDGQTWEQVGTIAEHYSDHFYTSASSGVYNDSETIFQTQDGGRTWKDVYKCLVKAEVEGLTRNVDCTVIRFHFPSPQVGYALAGNKLRPNITIFLKTTDGGNTWSAISTIADERAHDGGIFFTDENTGYYRSNGGKAYRTTDGGQTWKQMIAPSLGSRIRFSDPQVGWSFANLCIGMGCENAKLAFTTDGGQRWTTRSFPFPAGVSAFSLPSRTPAHAVGDHGMIYRYRIVPFEYTAKGIIDAPMMPAAGSAK